MRYEFGKNWAAFAERHLSDDKIRDSRQRLLQFLKLPDLRGKSFLDIGSGSGLHSLAAHRAGAESILSFDFDPDSVATTNRLREWSGSPSNWTVRQGSILDTNFLSQLPQVDIVYSWGVLHHTGDMWTAVANAASFMKPDGVFFLALYTSDVYVNPSPEYWLRVKQAYNLAGPWRRRWMELTHICRFCIWDDLRARRNPLKRIFNYSAGRGMVFLTDLRDWLGGWPMEFAGLVETKDFCEKKLELEVLNVNAGEGNTEYLVRRRGATNWWDTVLAAHPLVELNGPFVHRAGHGYVASLPAFVEEGDSPEFPRRSRVMLYEDGVPFGFAHAPDDWIVTYGRSRYSHAGSGLLFSTSDNSNPNTNGCRYAIRTEFL